MSLRLDWCSHEAAKYAVEYWHYSKCLPIGATVKIGVWEDGKFIGVVIFSHGTCGHLFARFGMTQFDGCELTRIALDKHKTPVSRIIAIAIKMLVKQSPKIRLLVSFAAMSEGHHGGIYQASGWIYDGNSSYKQEYMVNGRRVTDRTVSSWVLKGKVQRKDLTKIESLPKHRYFMPLDEEMRQRILPLSKPYPKRASGETPSRSTSVEN